MKVHVYAALKEYFEPEFEVTGAVNNTDELTVRLVAMNELAGELLHTCRFAIEDGFIDKDFKLQENDTVIIVPPASGG